MHFILRMAGCSVLRGGRGDPEARVAGGEPTPAGGAVGGVRCAVEVMDSRFWSPSASCVENAWHGRQPRSDILFVGHTHLLSRKESTDLSFLPHFSFEVTLWVIHNQPWKSA